MISSIVFDSPGAFFIHCRLLYIKPIMVRALHILAKCNSGPGTEGGQNVSAPINLHSKQGKAL